MAHGSNEPELVGEMRMADQSVLNRETSQAAGDQVRSSISMGRNQVLASVPETTSDLRKYLDHCFENRRGIPRCHTLFSPLENMLSGTQGYEWNDQCIQAYQTLKSRLPWRHHKRAASM